MDVSTNVDMLCADENCGWPISLVVNPVNEQVTYLVVTEKAFPNYFME
jgi:hypothetical protein